MDLQQIKARLLIDEGSEPFVYQDTRGFWTIGVGFCIDSRVGARLPDKVRDFWLECLVVEAMNKLPTLSEVLTGVDEIRKQLLVCLLYNMGKAHLEAFHLMLTALSAGDYDEAANQLQNSAWFKEVGVRGPLYVRIMRTGVWE